MKRKRAKAMLKSELEARSESELKSEPFANPMQF